MDEWVQIDGGNSYVLQVSNGLMSIKMSYSININI
jgi:hypothetical protein